MKRFEMLLLLSSAQQQQQQQQQQQNAKTAIAPARETRAASAVHVEGFRSAGSGSHVRNSFGHSLSSGMICPR